MDQSKYRAFELVPCLANKEQEDPVSMGAAKIKPACYSSSKREKDMLSSCVCHQSSK
jgi:hypothetical protein